MAYTAKTAKAFREEGGSLAKKITDELALVDAELAVIEAKIGTAMKTGAAASVADGGTITHGLGATPTAAIAVGSVAGDIVTVTAIGATTITVAIKTPLQAPGTTQTIYWMVQ